MINTQGLLYLPLLTAFISRSVLSLLKSGEMKKLANLSRQLAKCLRFTSKWNKVYSFPVQALLVPPRWLRYASKSFSVGYFKLPINTTVKKNTNICVILLNVDLYQIVCCILWKKLPNWSLSKFILQYKCHDFLQWIRFAWIKTVYSWQTYTEKH